MKIIDYIKNLFDNEWRAIFFNENWKFYWAFKTNWGRILYKHEITDNHIDNLIEKCKKWEL